jgi:Transcriptional activator TraM
MDKGELNNPVFQDPVGQGNEAVNAALSDGQEGSASPESDEPAPAKSCATRFLLPHGCLSRINDGIEAFRLQLQKEPGLSIGPKDPLLALWVSQRELLEHNAAKQQKLLSEFQAALGRNQSAWSDQAKALAQQSLNAGLQAAQNSTALLLEEAARMKATGISAS